MIEGASECQILRERMGDAGLGESSDNLNSRIESKEAAGELSEKTKQKAKELAEELREAREKREQEKNN